jgi:molecular chaperone Hsp33
VNPSPQTSAKTPANDLIQPFQVERFGLRGRLVRLGAAADDILTRHAYPEPVAIMLGQMMAVAAILAGALKYDGVFTLQTQGNGPIRLMVADITSTGDMRAYAQYDAEKLAALAATMPDGVLNDSVPHLLGSGYLAFTVDQGPDTERYQGIVDLDGATLADCLHHYFRQSEQIDAAIKVAVTHQPSGAGATAELRSRWQVGALMVQRLPKAHALDEEEREEGWREAVILMGSATNQELLDPALHPDALLYRLFHEPGVRVYKPMVLRSACRCSSERVSVMLKSFPKEEIESMKVDDKVVVTCEFCRRTYTYDQHEIDSLYAG